MTPEERREAQRRLYWKNLEASRRRGREKWHRRGLAASNRVYNPTPQVKARETLRDAVKHRRVTKPDSCERCGNKTERRFLHGHHHDYSRPLDVEWLCSRCHGVESRVA